VSVQNVNSIDGVAQVEKTGDIVILIVDALPWEEPDHLQLLENKINVALNYVKSGKIFNLYPQEAERIKNNEIKVIFQLAVKYPPTKDADVFLKKCYNILKTVGITLECKIKN